MTDDGLQLSDEARRQIRAEEVFRSEVRRELVADEQAPEPTGLARLASSPLLNKPIVLWFLSSVVLTGLGWLFNEWETTRELAAANRAEISRLNIEIYGRIERSRNRMQETDNLPGFRQAVEYLDEDTGLIPSLSDRSMESLLIALPWLLPDADQSEVAKARDAYQAIQSSAADPGADIAATIQEAIGQLDNIAAATGVGQR